MAQDGECRSIELYFGSPFLFLKPSVVKTERHPQSGVHAEINVAASIDGNGAQWWRFALGQIHYSDFIPSLTKSARRVNVVMMSAWIRNAAFRKSQLRKKQRSNLLRCVPDLFYLFPPQKKSHSCSTVSKLDLATLPQTSSCQLCNSGAQKVLI